MGVCVADMAAGIITGAPNRVSGAMALHVLKIMHAFGRILDTGERFELDSTCERPAPLPENLLGL